MMEVSSSGGAAPEPKPTAFAAGAWMDFNRYYTTPAQVEAQLKVMQQYGINTQYIDGGEESNGVLESGIQELLPAWIKQSHSHSMKVILVLNSNDLPGLSSTHKATFVSQVKSVCSTYDIDGVCLDIEPTGSLYNSQSARDSFLQFVKEVKEVVNGKSLHLCSSAWTEEMPDAYLTALSPYVDVFCPMIYDTLANGIDGADAFVSLWASNITRYTKSLGARSKLHPILPCYDRRPKEGKAYHDPDVENVSNAVKGIAESNVKLSGASVFWWTFFTRTTADTNGHFYSGDRDGWSSLLKGHA